MLNQLSDTDFPGTDRPDFKADQVDFYTDPLCCWSWAMAPDWDKLTSELGERLKVIYKMGGLLPSWKHFQDASHSISRPSQMGPEWMHAAEISGTPINSRVWTTDPPSSSYPACIAIKCVQLQSQDFASKFLHIVRKAIMVDGINIAGTDALFDAARLLHDEFANFDLVRFRDDLMGSAGKEAFRKDLQDVKYLGINRFPTLVIRRSGQPTAILTGYQTYESLRVAIVPEK